MSFTNLFRQRKSSYDPQVFSAKLQEVKEYCTLETIDIILVHHYREIGLKILKDIAVRMNTKYIKTEHAMTLVWCALSCVQHFHYSISTRECALNKIPKKKRKKLIKAFDTLSLIIHKLPNLSKSVHAAVLNYLTDASLWDTECLSSNIIKKLMVNPDKSVEMVNAIFMTLEKHPLTNENDGRVIIRVLCRVLENYNWVDFNIEMMNKILTMFYHSVKVKDDTRYKYIPLRRGLEICIKTIIKNVPNQHILMIIDMVIDWVLESEEDEPVYDFGTILQFASIKHKVNFYFESLTNKLFNNIIRLIESDNCVYSLLGHKMFQNLLDRNNNARFMSTPRIFFMELKYDIIIKHLHDEDKIFIKKYRKAIHDCIMACIKQHGTHRGIVETVFTSLALMIIEVKCGFTSAAVVCIVMNIQEYVLSAEYNEKIESAHRLHALVMSILSLICWVHGANTFYNYLYDIMKWRAYEAPYLNPPLKYRYQYAEHHVLWNKKELFFEDWKVRYGIWNCFRHANNSLNTSTLHMTSSLNVYDDKD